MTEDFVPFTDYKPVEILLHSPDDFLRIAETLTRMGLINRNSDTLYQSCFILHKRGRYAICHMKEMYILDGGENTIEESDIQRRNRIAMLLDEWKLCEVIDKSIANNVCPMRTYSHHTL